MNIIVSDIDQIIVSLTDLPELVNLGCANKYFHNLVSRQPIMNQWLFIKKKYPPAWDANTVFIEVCRSSFLSYAMFLIRENKIDIHAKDESAFRYSCANGHIEIAHWLIHLGESENYNKINIHTDNEYAFQCSCINGHIEMARWLIKLGESENYSKINIHANNEFAFQHSCQIGHIEMAHWLIRFGESSDYNKIDIHAYNEHAFRLSCINGHSEIAHWLIQLGESESYNKINPLVISGYIKELN